MLVSRHEQEKRVRPPSRRGTPAALVLVLGALVGLALHAQRSALLAQDTSVLGLTPARVLTLVKGDRPAEVSQPLRSLVTDDGRLFLTDPGKGDVLQFDENLVWQGSLAAAHPQRDLGRPVRTVLDSRGRIYVADADSRQIWVIDGGVLQARRGGRGDEQGKFGSLDDIAVDVDDMVWAADGDRGRLYVFTRDGLLERVVLGFSGAPFKRPRLVAVDAARDIYVYDEGRKAVLAGRADGSHRWTLDLNQRLDGEELYDLAVDPTGVLFLVLKDKSRVVIVEPSGDVRREIFGPGGQPTRLERITGIAISGPRRVMTLVDQKDLLVQEVRLEFPDVSQFLEPVHRRYSGMAVDTLSGRLLAISPASPSGPTDERWLIQNERGMAVTSPAGDVIAQVAMAVEPAETPAAMGSYEGFVVVDRSRRMHHLSRDGALVGSMPPATAGGELRRPEALAWRAEDGAMAVYDRDDDEIQILGPDGIFRQRVGRKGTGEGEISKVVAMAFDASGKLFVTDLQGTRIQVFDEHGIFVSKAAPATINTRAGGTVLGAGADDWGRVFLLDGETGTAVQIAEGRVQCQIGAPWLLSPVTDLKVTPSGDMVVSGGEHAPRAVRFRCEGPPPAPKGLRLILDPTREGGAVLSWDRGTPGAVSYEIRRRQGGEDERVVARSEESSVALPQAGWGTDTGELSVRGISRGELPGLWSEWTSDRLTPALWALVSGDDPADAEARLREELDEAQATEREDVVALRALYLESIVAQGEHERAAAELDSFGEGLDAETAEGLRLEIARSAISAAIVAGAGAVALDWLRPVGRMAPETLSAVEQLALEIDGAGDGAVAAELLGRHGDDRNLDGAELTIALAEVQMDAGRPERAMSTLLEASREASDVRLRRELDRGIFRLSVSVVDGLLDGSVAHRLDLTAEQQIDVLLRELELYAAESAPGSQEEWDLRLGALGAKPRIHRALNLEGSDFESARALYRSILDETPFLLGPDEIRVRGHLGALALAQGREDEARSEFGQILELVPNWAPDEDEFSPSVRDFVAAMQRSGEEMP
jgi:sugar lactone lactonase YvrE/tetratricopeptide (TPR) repeat protein